MNPNRFVSGRWAGMVSAALAAVLAPAVTLSASSTFMPPAATKTAADVDSIYAFLLIASLISFILLIGGMCYFVYKYQRRSATDKTAYITHDYRLEFAWSFVPFLIFMFVFVWGWKVYNDMRTVPEGALEVQVMAKKGDGRFGYKSGKVVTAGLDAKGQKTPATLVVPAGQPVKLVMGSEKISESSNDPLDRPVLHSFFLPAARIKQDVVPGRYTTLWFNLDQPGEYWVFCAEFCGAGHSAMKALVKAVPPADFEKWLASEGGGTLSLADRGRELYAANACIGCHTADGSKSVGPTFKGLWGMKQHKIEGGSVVVDENYIRESILDPNAKISAGFAASKGVMPVFAGTLSEDDINAIIEFIKSLK